jgi:hypothetical protein
MMMLMMQQQQSKTTREMFPIARFDRNVDEVKRAITPLSNNKSIHETHFKSIIW